MVPIVVLAVVGALPLLAQSASVGPNATATPAFFQWFFYSGNHPVAKKWDFHFDGGWRQNLETPTRQWLVRPGLNYRLNRNVQLSAAYSYFNTRPDGLDVREGSAPEHRLQEQLSVSKRIGRLGTRHRFRADQRFLGSGWVPGVARTWNTQHRARYQFRTDIPLGEGGARGRVALRLYNEIFFRFDHADGAALDKNRVFGGFAIRPARDFVIESGAFWQLRKPPHGDPLENGMFFLLGLRSTVSFRRLFGHRASPGS